MAKNKLKSKPQTFIRMGLADLVKRAHGASMKAGWYHNPKTGKPKPYNKGEKLMLIVSEVAEAMEGERKDLMDDKLKHRKMAEVELADAVIRIADYCGKNGYDLAGAVMEKMAFNKIRPDHKKENRMKKGGKKF